MNKDISQKIPALFKPQSRDLICRHFEETSSRILEKKHDGEKDRILNRAFHGLRKIDVQTFISNGARDLTAKGRLSQALTASILYSYRAAPEDRQALDVLQSQLEQRIGDRRKNREKFKAYGAENKKLERELATDPLTGVHSRKGLMQAMTQALSETRRYGRGLTVAILDLNGFKAINDTFGHERGDEALIHVAERLKDALRATDTVGRLGGDEFMIVLPCDGKESLDENEIRTKILNAFNGMVFWDNDKPYPLTASIGLSVCPPHRTASEDENIDLDTLASKMMKEADVQMYEDKKNNKEQRRQEITERAYTIPENQRCAL